MNNIYFSQALYILYPQVIYTRNDIAYDAEGNEVAYDPIAVQEEANKLSCKDQATTILNNTDWTSIADVSDPAKANPYLVNQADFISYRSAVRALAVNPVANPVWPVAPTEQWSTPTGTKS
jgi:hypothetical protein